MESSSNSTVRVSDSKTIDIKSGVGDNSVALKKTIGDHDLKNSIIEFMRVRPFLWNCRDPSYKDYRRRELEFREFSDQIGVPIREIKRVWHVLRTNFFRAHKLLIDRPNQYNGNENGSGEKLWKYYLAMEYILGGINNGTNEDSQNLTRQSRNRDCKVPRDGRQSTSTKSTQRELNNSTRSCKLSGGGNSSAGLNSNFSPASGKGTLPNSEHPSSSIMETDDDHLYARSITSTLKKFDPTTKEIIKLKFQQIIVSYMRQQSQSQQVASEATTNSDGNEDVSLFNSK